MSRDASDDEGSAPGRGEASAAGASGDGEKHRQIQCEQDAEMEENENHKKNDLLEKINRLKEEHKRMRDERKRIRADLRNAERRRARIRKKAKQLSDNDLVEVLRWRNLGEEALKALRE